MWFRNGGALLYNNNVLPICGNRICSWRLPNQVRCLSGWLSLGRIESEKLVIILMSPERLSRFGNRSWIFMQRFTLLKFLYWLFSVFESRRRLRLRLDMLRISCKLPAYGKVRTHAFYVEILFVNTPHRCEESRHRRVCSEKKTCTPYEDKIKFLWDGNCILVGSKQYPCGVEAVSLWGWSSIPNVAIL